MSNQRFGTGVTTGNLTQAQIDSFGKLLRVVRLRFSIADINPAPGVWNFSILDNAVNLCVKNTMSLIFQMWRSPLENIPSFWTKAPNNVPIVTTDDTSHSFNQYPYYLDTNFRSLCKDAQQHLSDHLNTYTQQQKAVFICQLGSFGVTGDYGSYKGNPLNTSFAISAPNWMVYVHEELAVFQSQLPTWLLPAANPDNDAKDYDYDISQGIRKLKNGELGHGYGQDGEGTYFNRLQGSIKSDPSFVFFSESEGIQLSPGWKPQDFFMVAASFLTSGAQILSVAGTDAITAVALNFLNDWAGVNLGGFCVMRDELDYADKTRFSEVEFGNVIDPAKQKAYDNNVKKINADTTMGAAAKAEKLSSLLANDLNPARKSKIQATYPEYKFDETSFYTNDGAVDLWKGNYERGIHFVNYDSCSVALQRQTDPMLNAYGRSCRQLFASAVFDIINYPSPLPSVAWKVSVTFLDNSKRISIWIIYGAQPGAGTRTMDVKGLNSGQWITHEFIVPATPKGLKSPDGTMHDFQVQFTGAKPIIQKVEVR